MIEIEQRANDFVAYVAGNRKVWECAPTAGEASLRLQLRLKTEELTTRGGGYDGLPVHPYHCMFCGRQLSEIGLGLLACACGKQYLPFLDKRTGAPCMMLCGQPEPAAADTGAVEGERKDGKV